ncbi:cation-binding protein [archaeon]|nr:cation-binding protein [archaeon]|tara:strand:+ start:1571 stop:2122 length:552 start_codon:yes stop_codon:yes gene_type:complete
MSIRKPLSKTSTILFNEHKNILKVIKSLEKECENIEKGKDIDKTFFREAIEFIRNYADRFHHAKEEDILFKEFNKKVEQEPGCAHCNPVEQMLIEHDEGRAFVKAMEQAVEKEDKNNVIENARGYAALLQEHIFKEDNILYPMTDDALDEKTKEQMLEKFNKIQDERKDEEKKYIQFVRGLKE